MLFPFHHLNRAQPFWQPWHLTSAWNRVRVKTDQSLDWVYSGEFPIMLKMVQCPVGVCLLKLRAASPHGSGRDLKSG